MKNHQKSSPKFSWLSSLAIFGFAVLTAYLGTTGTVFASNDESESMSDLFRYLPFLLLVAGPIFFGFITIKYRGDNKRHDFEKSTEAELDKIQGKDVSQGTIRTTEFPLDKGNKYPVNEWLLDEISLKGSKTAKGSSKASNIASQIMDVISTP
jgi:hypothetical protein